jgi:hypothetical protein
MITITTDDYMDMCSDHGGYCLACGMDAYGIEPDARNYKCEECGKTEVFGIEELLLMGEINFEEDNEGE